LFRSRSVTNYLRLDRGESVSNLQIGPLRTFRPLSEEVYERLRSAILIGDLPAGSRIVEADVARRMAISRTPVREAVRRLEQEAMVKYVPRRGTIVVGLSREDVADAYQLRAYLEAYGARLAATRAGDTNLAHLTELIQQMREYAAVQDLERLVAADVEFHEEICRASGSRRLLQAWQTLNPAQLTMISGLRVGDLSLEQIAERHWSIVAALKSRKPELAESIIRAHILELGDRVLAGLDQIPPASRRIDK
jgi:DNA-binding GntR family transcriptional regulator